MEINFINYPKCSTCVKAKKWLEKNGVNFNSRDIVQEKLSETELKKLIKKSGLPLKKFFNTSGILYREMNIKDKFSVLSEEELIKLLSSNGMLVKRPILVTPKQILVGFKEADWEQIL